MGNLIWTGIMTLALVYFGYHLVLFFSAHLAKLLITLGGA
jgi:hypothetical protein